MSLKSILCKPFAAMIARKVQHWSMNPIETQERVFQQLVSVGRHTVFGHEHRFSSIHSYKDFKIHVPIRDYEDFKPYIDRVKNGESSILWKGVPLYLSKTSGTTSGVKYIPITKESIPNHIQSARDAILLYINETGKSAFVDGKMLFLSGSPELETTEKIMTGRLSGIVNHYVPSYLRGNQVPTYTTNCIEDWEAKVDAIVKETIAEDMTVISGIPPWVQMYFDKILQKSGADNIKKVFENFGLFIYGGVNYEPYRKKMEATGSVVASPATDTDKYIASFYRISNFFQPACNRSVSHCV